MIIAVAGPYSAETEIQKQKNLDALSAAALEIMHKGHTPLIGLNAALPIAHLLPQNEQYEAIMAISMAQLKACDALFLLAESPGALREHDYMQSMGKPIYKTLKDIPHLK